MARNIILAMANATHKRITVSSLAVVLLLALAVSALAQQTTDISWVDIGARGAPSSGRVVTLNAMIGPSPGGPDLGAGYRYRATQAADGADLAIEKQALAASVTAGEELTYAITVTNLGPGGATGVEVLDLVPPGSRVVAITADNPFSGSEFCSLNGMCELGTLPSPTPGISLANDTPGQADGSTLNRTVTIESDDLPAGATVADVDLTIEFEKTDSESCAIPYSAGYPFNREIVFYLTSPGGTRVVLVESQNNWGGSGLGATYTAIEYGGDVTVTFDDSATSLVGPMPLSGTFRPVQPLAAFHGESPFGTWTLTAGDDSAQDALCLARFELVVTAVADVEATVSLVLGVDPDYAGDALVNQVRVSAGATDPDETNNIATATTLVNAEADLGIAKSVLQEELCLGAYNVYEIEVTNDGPSDAVDVSVTDVLPNALVYGGGSPRCTYDGAVRCGLERLPAGESYSFLVGVNLAPGVNDGTWIANTATVVSATRDPNPGNDTSPEAGFMAVQCFLPAADLALVKTATEAASAGEQITYTLAAHNVGPSDAKDVTIVDTLPAGVTLVEAGTGCTAGDDGTVTCGVGTLSPGGQVSVTLVVLVDGPVEPGTSLENVAVVTAATPDTYMANNVDVASTRVAGLANLALDKQGPPGVVAGKLITYTLIVSNAGPSTAESVVVADKLPEDVTLIAASYVTGNGRPIPCGGATCHLGDLAASAKVTVTVVGRVDGALLQGTVLTNSASVFSNTPEADARDDSDDHTCLVTYHSLYLPLVAWGPPSQPLPPRL